MGGCAPGGWWGEAASYPNFLRQGKIKMTPSYSLNINDSLSFAVILGRKLPKSVKDRLAWVW